MPAAAPAAEKTAPGTVRAPLFFVFIRLLKAKK
jgi:hypothetical protein